MLFNSVEFLVFFAVVTTLYFVLPLRLRWLMLLLASCWFYMAFIPAYILILLFTIVIDWVAGLLIARARGRTRKAALLVSLAANIGVLAVFKYWNFLAANVGGIFSLFGTSNPVPILRLVLPIGLSFHTFQAMSYTIEVYRGNQPPERNFFLYALYVMFYPQLVAGPIERPQNLLHQFRQEHRFDYDRVTDGLKLMVLGLLKKVVVADRLAALVDPIYSHPQGQSGPALALATILFAFQIYADFSGYSDVAIGCARVMGIDLMVNFRRPYLATSISEFWQRWHISLSTWFRDYLYIPLGGSRVGLARWQINLLITFLVSGLWHGASWTFVIWGGLNGLYLIGEIWLRRLPGAPRLILPPLARRLVVFALIDLSWIFFRAGSAGEAWYVITHLTSGYSRASLLGLRGAMGTTTSDLQLALAALFALLLFDALTERREDWLSWLRARPTWQRWALYQGAAVAVFFLGRYGGQQFIYFQF